MKYILYLLFALFTASFDRWIGESLFFIFPIFAVYTIELEKSDLFPLYFTFLYTIFYFSSRLELNFIAIIFFCIFLLLNTLLKDFKMNYFKDIFIFSILSFFLSIITRSYFSSIVGIIIMTIAYFVNMRLIINEREKG
jgi:hypothetical protein